MNAAAPPWGTMEEDDDGMLSVAASPERLFLDFVQKGDQSSLQRLLEAELPRVWRLARRILPSDQDAEDAVQEALLRLHRSSQRYDGQVPFRAWLARLVHAAAVNRLHVLRRQQGREMHMADESHPTRAQDPAYAVQTAELAEILHELLAQLPERYREPLALVHLAELPHAEVARALGLKASALSMRLRRGCERLAGLAREAGLALSVPALELCLSQVPVSALPAGLATVSTASSGSSVMAVAAVGSASGHSAAPWVVGALAFAVLGGGAALWWSQAQPAAAGPVAPPAIVEAAAGPVSEPDRPLDQSWDFDRGPVDEIELVDGEWRWEDDADGKGAGMRVGDGALVLLPAQCPARPFVVEVEFHDLETHPEASLFIARWVGDDEQVLPCRVWSSRISGLKPDRRGHYLGQVYFSGQHSQTLIRGQLGTVMEYQSSYPGRQVALMMSRMKVTGMAIRELRPDEIPKQLRDPGALVHKLTPRPDAPERPLRGRE